MARRPPGRRHAARLERALERDLRILARFIGLFCGTRHRDREKTEASHRWHDVRAIHGKPLALCAECSRLLGHAFTKRTICPLDPKPACKRCPSHCYAPSYRAQIREVMKVSGRKMVLRGRLDYLLHMLIE